MNITINIENLNISFVPGQPEQTDTPARVAANHSADAQEETQAKRQAHLLHAQIAKQRLTDKVAQLFGTDIALQYQAGAL